MIALHPGENIVQSVHRHWIVIAQKMTMIIVLLLVPLIGLFVIPFFSFPDTFTPLIVYLFSLYILFVANIAFGMWMDYYLDIWIITTKRIITIEHRGVFHREVSEFLIDRIQDVTTHNPNFISLFLGYGTIEIHTAGEKTFTGNEFPHIKDMKDSIIRIRMARNHERTF